MNILLYIVGLIIIGALIISIIKKKKIGLIVSSIPGIIGIYFLIDYYTQKASCDASLGCEMGQAGMLSFYGYVFIIFSIICFMFVVITQRIRVK